MKKITIAGNILVDKIKITDSYPKEGMLSNIIDTTCAVGGCVPNTAVSLSKMKSDIKLSVLGKIGNDDDGKYVLKVMSENNIDVTKVMIDQHLPTSYTDVMTVKRTGNRTFFHNRGANANFAIDDINIDSLDCDLFHIGYILLLDSLDKKDEHYGTAMAKLLSKIQQQGIKTSIDLVSENSDRFNTIVVPALKYCDYCIINEIEAGEVANISPRDENGNIDICNIKEILEKLFYYGVREKAVIHAVEGGYLLNNKNEFTFVPSLNLPKEYIAGSVGAGDAFCAGSLYAIAKGYDDNKLLRYASLAAACNLSHADSIGGLRSENEIWELENKFERRGI